MAPQTADLGSAERPMSVMYRVTAAFFLTMMLVSHVTAQQPSVTLNSTVIHGNYKQVGGVRVSQFLGIRFGQSPTGALRFQKPRAAQLTEGDVNATQHGAPCASILPSPGMSEDCLFLDVYVPERSEGAGLLPVMVWLYGGGFYFGSNKDYDGHQLAAEGDVIVVSPNYRLGPLGFLSTGDNSSPGNYGLWDQWLALKWVQDNIPAFGGDVSNITLFGESAGAASVSYQMTSPQSVNLFHKVILQSGNRLCPWTYNCTYTPLAVANGVARALNCRTATQGDSDSSSKMMSCLREKSYVELISAGNAVALSLGIANVWTPVTDGDFVLPYDQSPKFSGPFMAGFNNHEGALIVASDFTFRFGDRFYNRTFLKERILTDDVLKRMEYDLVLSADPQALQHAVRLLDSAFRTSGSTHNHVALEELVTIVSARNFWVCTQKVLDSGPTTDNAFLYYFDHHPDAASGREQGMSHAMDLWYTFGSGNTDSTYAPNFTDPAPPAEVQLGQRFRAMLTNFAKNGDPSRPNDASGWPAFPPYTKGDKSYLSVSTAPTVQSHVEERVTTLFLDTVPALLRSRGQGQGQGQGGCTGGATSLLPASTIPCLLVWIAAVLICAI